MLTNMLFYLFSTRGSRMQYCNTIDPGWPFKFSQPWTTRFISGKHKITAEIRKARTESTQILLHLLQTWKYHPFHSKGRPSKQELAV